MLASSAQEDPPAPTDTAGAAAPPDASGSGQTRSLARNALYLTLGNAATIPIAIVTNGLLGRYLGPAEFGYIYLATTLCSFAQLALEWGQQGAVPALVARDRERAGSYLGSSLVWRSMMGVLIMGVLLIVCKMLGYGPGQTWAVALTFPFTVLVSCAAGIKDTIRGFERTDIPALAHVGQQLLALLTVVPVLLLGGRMRAVLLGNIVVVALTLLLLSRTLRPLGVRRLRFDRTALKALFGLGTPFVFFDLAMVLLPNVNATFLSRLVPPEVIGWYGVSQRLIGLLIFPATALVGALYPTLCRLQAESSSEFARVSRDSIYGTALLAVPAAVGCGLFPEVGVSIFGREKFSGALAHLQVMSAFIFLVYFSMPIGTAILASNKQRAWALVQSSCIVVALCGNPFLIPYFQRLTGNGAIGTCVTLVASEAFVVGCGIALLPRGVFNLQLVKALLAASASGAAMALVGWFTKPISIFVALPAAVLTYAGAAYFSGAVQPSTIEMIKGVVNRKILRRA